MSVTIERRSASTPGQRIRAGLPRDDRGGMVAVCAVMIPALVGFGMLAANMGYGSYRNLLLHQTVQSAALAAANKLSTYYSTGSNSTVVSTAQTFATANMPTSQYGTVVPAANVTIGTWSASTGSFSAGGSTPNAVKVIGASTTANGNPVSLFLGSFYGQPTLDLTTTVVASYATGKTFNTIVLNDMSQSFTSELSNQQAADRAILNCVKGQTGSTSKFGITLINGHATTYQALSNASSNLTTLLTTITGLTALSCLTNCSTGSNVAAGIYSAIQQFSSSAYNGTSKNIVVITDGVPDAKSITYSAADGVTCTTNCTNALLLTGAQTQAAAARTAGINISTIYYSGNTATADQASYATSVGSLVTGTGVALVAPTPASINTAYAGFCSTIPSSLKTVM